MNAKDARRAVGGLAKRYRAGELSFAQFLDLVPRQDESEDDDVSELLDLIEHEPKRGGLFGVSEEEYARHLARIDELIARLLDESSASANA